jgi:hypothetical protein
MLDINWSALYGFSLVAKYSFFAETVRAFPRDTVQALNKDVRQLESGQDTRGVKGVELTESDVSTPFSTRCSSP